LELIFGGGGFLVVTFREFLVSEADGGGKADEIKRGFDAMAAGVGDAFVRGSITGVVKHAYEILVEEKKAGYVTGGSRFAAVTLGFVEVLRGEKPGLTGVRFSELLAGAFAKNSFPGSRVVDAKRVGSVINEDAVTKKYASSLVARVNKPVGQGGGVDVDEFNLGDTGPRMRLSVFQQRFPLVLGELSRGVALGILDDADIKKILQDNNVEPAVALEVDRLAGTAKKLLTREDYLNLLKDFRSESGGVLTYTRFGELYPVVVGALKFGVKSGKLSREDVMSLLKANKISGGALADIIG
jgi:hypothetical protein